MRHSVKRPDQLAGANVERANVARARLVFFVCGRSQDQEVFEYLARCRRLNQRQTPGIASEAISQFDTTIHTEGSDGFTGAGINRLQKVIDREQQTTLGVIGTLPIINATIRDQMS